jgi:hypothetical protein
MAKWVGRNVRILVEDDDGLRASGLTEHFLAASCPSGVLPGSEIAIRADLLHNDVLECVFSSDGANEEARAHGSPILALTLEPDTRFRRWRAPKDECARARPEQVG